MEDTISLQKPQKQQDIYQRIRILGTGSFGKAILVKEIKTQLLYVIKQINIADLEDSEQESARTQAKILEALDHPNVIKFKEVYTTSKMKLNIVMEYADGGDLSHKIQEAKSKKQFFDEQQILSWFTQICLGIKHIHDRKIIHRDLKGQNIFLTSDNCVKIGDLGVARVLEHTIAKARTMVGSPYYLSPQIIENRPYSFKSDIWSLGALLFQMCSLVPPFTANNLQFLALKIVKGSYNNIPPQYSSDLKALIKLMLNTNPNLRPNINQILSSPIINRRIKSLLTESQNIAEFSHTVLHKYNPIKKEVQDKLRPPPNLIQIEQEQISGNLSAMITNGEAKMGIDPIENKSKNPFAYGKNPPQKKRTVPVDKKILQETTTSDLSEIMKIKPSPLENPLPPKIIPKVVSPNLALMKKRPESSKTEIDLKVKNQTSSAFNKRKSADVGDHRLKQEGNKNEQKEQKRSAEQLSKHLQSEAQKGIKNKNFSPKNEVKAGLKKQENKVSSKKIQTKAVKQGDNKPKVAHKNIAKPKQKKQGKLQLVSEQMKQKEKMIQKEKKTVKKIPSKKPKVQPKKQTIEEQIEVTQQQKCNDIYDDVYENEQFEVYDENSDEQKTNEQDELSFQLSHSSLNQIELHRQSSQNNRQKMLLQLGLIHKLVQEANGKVDNLPMIGEPIPEILQMSNSIRQDDSDLQSEVNRVTGMIPKTETGMINLACLNDQGQLESLRMALEDIFGTENIIKAYQFMSNVIEKNGLDFNQEVTISSLLKQCPQLDEKILKKHFRLIATVITLQNQLQQ